MKKSIKNQKNNKKIFFPEFLIIFLFKIRKKFFLKIKGASAGFLLMINIFRLYIYNIIDKSRNLFAFLF